MSKIAFPATLPLSNAIRAGDFVFVSGQLAVGPDRIIIGDDIEAQTRQALENLRDALAQVGCDLRNVVKTTVWLRDLRDFLGFNGVYAEFFPKEPPARATVRADLLLGAKVEIEAVAYKPAAA